MKSQSLCQNAEFLLSAPLLKHLPPDAGIEVAFAGRSNAGKSTALNKITQQNKLARVSKQPGRTQAINLFTLDETRRLVDLPGYGYAQVPKAIKQQWQKTLSKYLHERECLRGLILLIDIRRPLLEMDCAILNFAADSNLETHILLTKADKLSRGAGQQTLLKVQKVLKESYRVTPTAQLFSAPKQIGFDEVYQVLDRWLNQDL